MSDWQEEDEKQDQWPVRYLVEMPAQEAARRLSKQIPPRWSRTEGVDTREVQRRLVWLLLAVEIGTIVAVVCVLPLALVKLSLQEEGVVSTLLTKVGTWLGLSSQVTCLLLLLPIPILMFTIGFNLWWFRRIRRRAEEAKNQTVHE
ncbi:MAG: hypothetical protein PVH17_01660 [Anaerolineae bacterium]|jgi:hypothetical protein